MRIRSIKKQHPLAGIIKILDSLRVSLSKDKIAATTSATALDGKSAKKSSTSLTATGSTTTNGTALKSIFRSYTDTLANYHLEELPASHREPKKP